MDAALFDRLVESLKQTPEADVLMHPGVTLEDAIKICRVAGLRLTIVRKSDPPAELGTSDQ